MILNIHIFSIGVAARMKRLVCADELRQAPEVAVGHNVKFPKSFDCCNRAITVDTSSCEIEWM